MPFLSRLFLGRGGFAFLLAVVSFVELNLEQVLLRKPFDSAEKEKTTTITNLSTLFEAENIQNCGQNHSLNDKADRIAAASLDPQPVRSAPCGHYNCFFHLKNNAEVGYLVRIAEHNATERHLQFESSVDVYNLAVRLEKTYGIRHFLMEPPRMIENPSPELVKCMNSQVYPGGKLHKRQEHIPEGEQWDVPNFKHDSHTEFLVVQKNRVAPTPNLLFKCGKTYKKTKNMWRKFLSQAGHLKRNTTAFGAFARNVQEEVEFASKLLEVEGDWLFADFQVMIDAKGHFNYIDIGNNGKSHPGKIRPERMAELLSVCRDSFLLLKGIIRNETIGAGN